MAQKQKKEFMIVSNPKFVDTLVETTRFSWIWLIARLYLAYVWIEAGWEKMLNPAWMQTGDALKGFWQYAVSIPDAPARPPIAFAWYRTFIQFLLDSQSYTWFAKLVAVGEFVIGVALLLGIFTGIAAFFGGFLNWNFMMAGSASVNPLMFVITVALILAWKVAGYYGVDRWLLPLLGTPWQPGRAFMKSKSA